MNDRKIIEGLTTALPLAEVMRLDGLVIFCFECSEADLIDHGLATTEEIPGPRRGCLRWTSEGLRITRKADGRCRVKVRGIRAAGFDLGFQDFMHGLLADRQLSLVAHEKGSAA